MLLNYKLKRYVLRVDGTEKLVRLEGKVNVIVQTESLILTVEMDKLYNKNNDWNKMFSNLNTFSSFFGMQPLEIFFKFFC